MQFLVVPNWWHCCCLTTEWQQRTVCEVKARCLLKKKKPPPLQTPHQTTPACFPAVNEPRLGWYLGVSVYAFTFLCHSHIVAAFASDGVFGYWGIIVRECSHPITTPLFGAVDALCFSSLHQATLGWRFSFGGSLCNQRRPKIPTEFVSFIRMQRVCPPLIAIVSVVVVVIRGRKPRHKHPRKLASLD